MELPPSKSEAAFRRHIITSKQQQCVGTLRRSVASPDPSSYLGFGAIVESLVRYVVGVDPVCHRQEGLQFVPRFSVGQTTIREAAVEDW